MSKKPIFNVDVETTVLPTVNTEITSIMESESKDKTLVIRMLIDVGLEGYRKAHRNIDQCSICLKDGSIEFQSIVLCTECSPPFVTAKAEYLSTKEEVVMK